jgi:adenosylcobinamide-GDP ribazoletransferase
MSPLARFLTALAFLTRLAPGRPATAAELALSAPWFPAVGLVLGLLLAGPAACGLLAGHPAVLGWLLVAGNAWLTRGLHLDGLADLADAWGSSAEGERFWTIMKDSRAGPFGVMAVVLALGLQAALLGELAALRAYGPVVFTTVCGRMACILLIRLARSADGLTRPGLASIFIDRSGSGPETAGLDRRIAVALSLSAAAGIWLMGPAPLALSLALAALPPLALLRLGRARAGLNGDFLGAAMVLGELCPGLAWLILR